MNLVNHYGFNENAKDYNVMEFKTVESVKKFLAEKFTSQFNFGMDLLLRNGNYRVMGTNYNFTPWLKKYFVEYPDGSLRAMFSPTKAVLRKACGLSRRVKIHKFPNA